VSTAEVDTDWRWVHAVAVVAEEPNPLHEWQECRLTIGRFDGYLADTRKYGFTLVTVLLTANALVTTANAAVDRPAASIVVMVLLLALFMIDNYYWVMLRAAVNRAKDLEVKHERITWKLSEQAKNSHATDLVLVFYGLFVAIAALIPVVALLSRKPIAVGGLLAVFAAVLVEAAAMFVVYNLVEHPTSRVSHFVNTVVPRPRSD
jgi:hypothetical protein